MIETLNNIFFSIFPTGPNKVIRRMWYDDKMLFCSRTYKINNVDFHGFLMSYICIKITARTEGYFSEKEEREREEREKHY